MFGGGLHKNEIYKHILSVGYEFETHDLCKLALQPDSMNLINTDTAPRILKQIKAEKKDDNYYKFKDNNKEITEFFDIPIIEQGKQTGKYNVVMNVATDIDNELPETDFKTACNKSHKPKNKLYAYNTKNQVYNIKFLDELSKTNCSQLAGVEYIITYYNPKKSNNILLDTFFNACSLVIEHLNSLVEIKGQFIIKDENDKELPFGNSIGFTNWRDSINW
jgi:hypothetical protein